MISTVGVITKNSKKVCPYLCETLKLRCGDKCVVEGDGGPVFGEVVVGNHACKEEMLRRPLKKVMRLATREDVEQQEKVCRQEKDAFQLCLDKIRVRELPMALVSVEFAFDGSKATFYFTADGRIDFRELVRDLAHALKTRVELKQIGVRDKAKLCGGIGPCGRSLCCVTFLNSFQPISIKMAKGQNLSLNPIKISGLCGRLMCCLNFERNLGTGECRAAKNDAVQVDDDRP